MTGAKLGAIIPACNPDHALAEVANASPSPLTHYVIVRTDLPLGILGANILHAAGESSPGNLPDGTHAIVLAAPSEDALRAVQARLALAGVPHREIVETDAPYAGQLMALGCVPAPKDMVHRFVSSLPLLRKEHLK